MNSKTNNPSSLVIRRVIKAKREQVFEAWTKPEIMCQWFYCGDGKAIVTNELRKGGSYQNKMIINPDDGNHKGCGDTDEPNTYIHSGEYLEISPPEKIIFTWNSPIVSDSRVTVELKDLGDSTELILTHELLDTEELKQMHSVGWEGCLLNLLNHLEAVSKV